MCRNGGRRGTGRFFESIKEVLSITAEERSPGGDKATWWWNGKVQEVILKRQ